MRSEWRTVLTATALLAGLHLAGCGDEKTIEDGGVDAGADGGGTDASPDATPDGSQPDATADGSGDAMSDATTSGGACGPDGWNAACGPDTKLLVSASVFGSASSSRIGLVDLSDGSVTWSDPITDDTDILVDRVGCTPVLLRRSTGEIAVQNASAPLTTARTLQVWPDDVTPNTWGYNPWDIEAVDGFRAVVAPYKVNELTLLDGTCDGTMARVGGVDLSGFMVDADDDGMADDTDGSVDAASVVVHEGRAYVMLARNYYDASIMGLAFVGGSVVAVVDLDTETLVDMDPDTDGVQGIALGYENPIGGAFVADVEGRATLYVGAVGNHGVADGAIVPVQLPAGTVQAPIYEETTSELLVDFVVDDGSDQAFLLVAPFMTDNPMSTSLLAISLADGTRRTIVSGTAATHLALVDGLPAGGGRTLAMLEGTNLRTFSVDDGSETTPSSGIDVTVPDSMDASVYYGGLVALP